MKTRIRELRKSKRMSQMSLAIAIGTSQNVISKIELEYSDPNADMLCKIADFFHTSVDYILYRTDQRYSAISSNTFNNARINEYILKLQTLPAKEQESILLIIDKFIKSEEMGCPDVANRNL